MKHDIKVTLILLAMFFITQLIGLTVINAYAPSKVIQVKEGPFIVNKTVGGNITIPYNMEPPEIKKELSWSILPTIIAAILLATLFFFILTKIRARFMLRAWFFFVILVTTAIALTALLLLLFPSLNVAIAGTSKMTFPLTRASLAALTIALILAFYKVVKRNLIVHNFTELLIYPGLAAIFVPFLYNISENITIKILGVIGLLLVISAYDMYAVWKSKFMVKLAKYQIQKLRIFTGFFLPYISTKALKELKKVQRLKRLKKLKPKTKAKLKGKRIKVSLAILGGGDVAFPLIFAGVVLRAHSFASALIVSIAVTISLFFLFAIAKRERFYPAMPFLTAGCIAGYLISLLF